MATIVQPHERLDCYMKKISETLLDDVKNFWDSRPCNIKHSDKEVGTKEYFLDVSAKKYKVEPHILKFADFSRWKGKKVLEIGCGIGTAAQSFAEAGAIYTGVDISEKSLNVAKKRFDVFNLIGDFYLSTDENFSQVVPVQKYDLVYSFGVIHHTPNPKQLIFEISKYMDKDSELKIMLYAENSWKKIMIDAGFDRPEAQAGCPIAETYTEESILDLLDLYTVTNIEQDHIFPYEIESYKKHDYKLNPWFEHMPVGMFSALEKKLGWHLLIDAKLK